MPSTHLPDTSQTSTNVLDTKKSNTNFKFLPSKNHSEYSVCQVRKGWVGWFQAHNQASSWPCLQVLICKNSFPSWVQAWQIYVLSIKIRSLYFHPNSFLGALVFANWFYIQFPCFCYIINMLRFHRKLFLNKNFSLLIIMSTIVLLAIK